MNRNVSQSRDVQISVSLSKLIPSKRNPRRVKPQREAHRQMVASIRAHGLLAPLVVRADDGNAGDFKVIAGNRRLAALREVYKDSAKPPKVLCVLRSVDDDTADALALVKAGQGNEAAIYLKELLSSDPGSAPANLGMARVYAQEGHIDEALGYYHHAIYGAWPANAAERRFHHGHDAGCRKN